MINLWCGMFMALKAAKFDRIFSKAYLFTRCIGIDWYIYTVQYTGICCKHVVLKELFCTLSTWVRWFLYSCYCNWWLVSTQWSKWANGTILKPRFPIANIFKNLGYHFKDLPVDIIKGLKIFSKCCFDTNVLDVYPCCYTQWRALLCHLILTTVGNGRDLNIVCYEILALLMEYF